MSSWQSRVNLRRLECISATLKDEKQGNECQNRPSSTTQRVSIHDRLKLKDVPASAATFAGFKNETLGEVESSPPHGHDIKFKPPRSHLSDATDDLACVSEWMSEKPAVKRQNPGDNKHAGTRVSPPTLTANRYTSRYRRQFRAYDSIMGVREEPAAGQSIQQTAIDKSSSARIEEIGPTPAKDCVLDADDLFDWDGDAKGKAKETSGGSELGANRSSRDGATAKKPGRKRKCPPTQNPHCVVSDGGSDVDVAAEPEVPRKRDEVHVGDLLSSVLVSRRMGQPLAKLGKDDVEEPLVIRADCNGKILKSGDQTGNYEAELQVPASINAYLREYQREGVRFLFRQYFKGLGGILADDMGLGKTVQCVAFATALLQSERLTCCGKKDEGKNRWPLLVVCPTSVIENWVREFSTWSTLKVGVYHGAGPIREATLEAAERGDAEIIITSYDLLRMHKDEFYRVPWHVAFFDEAHKLKNDRSQVYLACQRLPTKLRFGLTGTVMQNNFTELWCLMNWAVPGCLGEKSHFRSYYAKSIQMGQKIDSSNTVQRQGRERQAQLVKALSKVLLRRTKVVIQDQMPKKQDNVVFCELSLQQGKAYKRLLSSPDVQLLVNSDNPCRCGSGLTQAKCCQKHASREDGGVLWPQFHCCTCDNAYDPTTNPSGCKRHKPNGCKEAREEMGLQGRLDCPHCLVLPVLSLLRKISNHLELVKADRQHDEDQAQRDREVAELILGNDLDTHGGGDVRQNFLNVSDSSHCGKMAALETLMKLWHSQHDKVLIFSHSVRMLGIIERVVLRNGYEFVTLDGSTPAKERQTLVDEFNDRPSVFAFLISTTAGGLGLNLTSANRVVIFDPSWNPSHDLQAQDRAFRIGQRRDVFVYRLIAAGTLEEIVYTRQIYKQQQSNMAIVDGSQPRYFEGVQNNKEFKGELWGISNLLKLTADSVFTRDLFHQDDSSHFTIQEMETKELDNGSSWGGATGIFGELDADDEGLNQLAQKVVCDASDEKDRHGTELEQLREAGGAVYVHHHDAILDAKKKGKRSEKSDIMEDEEDTLHQGMLAGTTSPRFTAQQSSSPNTSKQEATKSPQRAWGRGGGRKSGVKILKAGAGSKVEKGNRDMGSHEEEMSVMESLAEWKGVGLKSLARRLTGMTKSDRQKFLAEYCADESNPG
ncbi:hypothetical protein BSKO_04113 [Bryopsis sp. KO-2023]|nr:hypothetical protein BSKO_04113 [Bryopsis sp. KO-2023]